MGVVKSFSAAAVLTATVVVVSVDVVGDNSDAVYNVVFVAIVSDVSVVIFIAIAGENVASSFVIVVVVVSDANVDSAVVVTVVDVAGDIVDAGFGFITCVGCVNADTVVSVVVVAVNFAGENAGVAAAVNVVKIVGA